MNADYNNIANSAIMWLACAPAVLTVFFQAINFYRKSKNSAIKMGIPKEKVTSAIRSAAVTSIGPCFVMLTAMLSLILYVGAPLAWLRVNFIGSVSYNLQGVSFVSDAMGINLGSPDMNLDFLVTTAIVLGLGSMGWVLFVALFADKMDKVNKFISGGNAALVPIVGGGALIGVFSSMTIDRLYPVSNQAVAVIVSGLLMFIIQSYNKKANKQWLKEWGLTLCMVTGMVAAVITG